MKKLQLATLSVCLIAAINAQAKEEVMVGETVVVTANRSSQMLLDSSSSMSVVSAQEIARSNVTSVPDLVKDKPGIRLVNDGTPGLKRVALRGESPNRTLVMVDSQRISDQKNKSGAPLLINPFFVDRIEIVRGPASVLYGSDAAGGIVNVISTVPSDKPFAFAGGVFYDGSANGFTENVTVSGTVDKFHYAIGGFNTNNDDIYLTHRTSLDNSSYDANGLNALLSYDINDSVTVGYRAEYFDLEAYTATTLDHTAYKDYKAHTPSWERYKHSVFLNAQDINEYIAAIDASFYFQKNDKDFECWPQKGQTVDVINNQETYGANVQFAFDLTDSLSLITGYDGHYEKLSSESNVSINMSPFFNGKFFVKDSDFEQYNHALYALLTEELMDDLSVSLGLRYNYVQNKAGSTRTDSRTTVMVGPNKFRTNTSSTVTELDDVSQARTLGSIGVVYSPFEYGAFRANWSQGFRAPSLQELFLTTSTGTLQYGNPHLDPETSDNFEVGFRWSDPVGLTADIALFYTHSKDYIETFSVKNDKMDVFTYRNIAKANSYGAELELSYVFGQGRYEPYLSLTAMEREYETEQGSTTKTGTPKFSGTAGFRLNDSLFTLDAYTRFASKVEINDLAGTSYFDNNAWGGYATWNLKASTDFGTNKLITVSASVENIFDKNYQTSELIHEPGRFFTVGISSVF